MRIITPDELIAMIPEMSAADELYERYIAWEWLNDEDQDKLTFLGMLAYTGTREEYKSPYDSWMPEYPIALHCYPNNDSEVYQYKEGLFLVYNEVSGFLPERRCRLVQRKLIVQE